MDLLSLLLPDWVEQGLFGQMMPLFAAVLIAMAVGYLFGSISTSVLVARLIYKDDVRLHGSGNAGATNALRTYGKKAALLTTLGDILKCIISVTVGYISAGVTGGYAAGAACIIGHIYPLYFGFRGGKGVMTSGAMILMLDWRMFLVMFGVFCIVFALTHYVSLSSIVGCATFPLVTYLFHGPDWGRIVFAVVMAGLVIWMHRTNIKRLLAGTESKMYLTAKGKARHEKS